MALKVSYFIQYSVEIYRGSIQTHLLFYQQFPLIFLIIFALWFLPSTVFTNDNNLSSQTLLF